MKRLTAERKCFQDFVSGERNLLLISSQITKGELFVLVELLQGKPTGKVILARALRKPHTYDYLKPEVCLRYVEKCSWVIDESTKETFEVTFTSVVDEFVGMHFREVTE